MLKGGTTLIPYPSHPTDYFYHMGIHYVRSSRGYYSSVILNKYGFVSFEKDRNFYEKIGKKEFSNKKYEYELSIKIFNEVSTRVQLTLF